MEKLKRYTVTIDLYVYANSDDDAMNEAKEIVKILENKNDSKTEILSIHETNFGSLESRELKI